MIKFFNILIILLVTGFSTSATAQFVNFQIKIEPEISASVEQHLNFGTQITNIGRTNIALGDVNMGVFSIRAFHTQNVYLNLSYPEYLVSEDSRINDRIPLDLSIAYNNSGENSHVNSTLLTENNGFISIHERTGETNKQNTWQDLYIYVFGFIKIDNVSNGVYTGNIILSIDYD